MSIDFTLSPELDELRLRVRAFVDEVIKPGEADLLQHDRTAGGGDRAGYMQALVGLRAKARDAGIWLPHMPAEWGGMGLGHVELAMVQAEAAKAYYGPCVFNCQAPDEGNMHTLLHWATDEQKEKYLRPLCDGTAMSCFAMTEPEVAGSDPTLIRPPRCRDGDEWVINGHKWFISNARGAQVRDPHRAAPRTTPSCRRRRTPRSSSTSRRDGLEPGARGRDDARRRRPLRDRHRGPARARRRTCSAAAARATCSASTASARPGSRTACAGSAQAETALDMMVDRSLQPLRPRLAARREAGHPVDDRRLHDGALPGQADGAARRLPHRPRPRLQVARCRWPSTSSPTCSAA